MGCLGAVEERIGLLMVKKRLSMCAGEFLWPVHIAPIVREYRRLDRVWFPDVTVFGDSPSMFPYRKYVPEYEHGGEG